MPSNRKPIKFLSETTEVDKHGNRTTILEIDDETAEILMREDLELAEQWAADLKTDYEAKKMEADAKVNECRRELHEFLAERAAKTSGDCGEGCTKHRTCRDG